MRSFLLLFSLFFIAAFAGRVGLEDERALTASFRAKNVKTQHVNDALLLNASVALKRFVKQWNGKGLNTDHNPYGFQCVEVPNQWAREIGIETFAGNANQFQFDPHPDCDWIANTPSNVPRPGDIMVWHGWSGNPFGHTSVFVNGDVNTFTSFDQNWPDGSLCHLQAHSYTNVAGWMHPRKLSK